MLVVLLACGTKPSPVDPEWLDTGEPTDTYDTIVEVDSGDSAAHSATDTAACNTTPWYLDADEDDYGAGSPVEACTRPGPDWTTNAQDCDDADASVNPAATWESCAEGIDRNCDGVINGVDDGVCDPELGHDKAIEGYSSSNNGYSWLADVDGDALSDIVVGTAGFHCVSDGYVHMFLATALAGVDTVGVDSAAVAIEGPWESCFGYSVADAGDIDGDGRSDILVGAPKDVRYNNDWTNSDLGDAYLFLAADLDGGAEFTEADGVEWPGGVESYDAFGQWVGPVGDVDGDGLADVFGSGYYARILLGTSILSGSVEDDIGLPEPIERDWLVSTGDVDGDGRDDVATFSSLVLGDSVTPGSDIAAGDEDYQFRGGDWDAALYYAAIAADHDNDGLANIVAFGFGDELRTTAFFRYPDLSSSSASSFDDSCVRVDTTTWTILDPTFAADIDGDGIPDIVGSDVAADSTQGVSVISGARLPTSGVVEVESWDRRLAEGITTVAADGDANGDGQADLLVHGEDVYLLYGW